MSLAASCPEELRVRPTGLVALSGLDCTYNAIHKIIWDLFSNNRKPDRTPLKFVLRDIGHDYPPSKPKKTSYESYMPKGILPKNWMKKHLFEVPSLIVTFFDLDWDDSHWAERMKECSTRLQIIRSSIAGRNTKIAVVLIQKSPPLPGEDNSAERASAFCTECEIAPKSLFILPHTAQLEAYIIRLEAAFYEQTQSYYTQNTRRIKQHRDFLNKTNHLPLMIRHQFKLGYLSEIKQDYASALRFYKLAFGHVMEYKMTDVHMLEIKTAASFISYKISSLCFTTKVPVDAISQFQNLMSTFKPRPGPADLLFEHSAWISLQFELFADLFESAIRSGLTALSTQHPGYYYHYAALNAIKRKQLCIGLCHKVKTASTKHETSMNIAELIGKMEFYGQRPWRAGSQSLEVDMDTEIDGYRALQSIEMDYKHSEHIIRLLNMSINQFRRYKSHRMIHSINVRIGEERYHNKEYIDALRCLNEPADIYRSERWYSLLTSVLTTSLRCAYLSLSLEDYIKISIELLSSHTQLSVETKSRIQVDLMQIVCGSIPDAEPGTDIESGRTARSQWTELFNGNSQVYPHDVRIDMRNLLSFVECNVYMDAERYSINDKVQLTVYLTCLSQFSIRFNKLAAVFNNQDIDAVCVLEDNGDVMEVVEEGAEETGDLMFAPNSTKIFNFTFTVPAEYMGKTLQVSHVELSWLSYVQVKLEIPVDKTPNSRNDETPNRYEAEVEARQSNLRITALHHDVLFVNELFKINWIIESEASTELKNMRVSWTCEQDGIACSAGLDQDNLTQNELVTNFSHLSNQQQFSSTIYMQSTVEKDIEVKCKCLYEIDGNHEQFVQTYDMRLPVIQPFAFSTRYLSNKMNETRSVNCGEYFLIQLTLRNKTESDLQIITTELQLCHELLEDNKRESTTQVSQMSSCLLLPNDVSTELNKLVISETSKDHIQMGHYNITWRRHSTEEECAAIQTSIELPTVYIESQPLLINCQLPAYACVHKPLPLKYQVQNRTGYVQEYNVCIERTEYFLVSGYTAMSFRVLPYDTHSLQFVAYPLEPGRQLLPVLKIELMNQKTGDIPELVNKMLPSNIYVMPSTMSEDR